MHTIPYKAEDRGKTEIAWLKSRHSFSFGDYYNPENMNFGALRVINDDWIAPGRGFGSHPHDNMEIVTIPLKGEVLHKDSTGKEGVIRPGDVQIMSAGEGVVHSEFNNSKTEPLELLQIWIEPAQYEIPARHEEKTFSLKVNDFVTLVSPDAEAQSLFINQNTYIYRGVFEEGKNFDLMLKDKSNGWYVFVIEGELEIAGQQLKQRDALGIVDEATVKGKVLKKTDMLIFEIPLK